jgi:hypothetical protein
MRDTNRRVSTTTAAARSVVDLHERARPSAAPTVVALLAWCALLASASAWGAALLHAHVHMQIGAPPLTGTVDWRPGLALVAVAALGVVCANALPHALERLSWHALLVVTPAMAACWIIAINVVDGWSALTRPVHAAYAATAAQITAPGRFLHDLLAHPSTFNIHTRGHPPGLPLLLWALRPLGVSGPTTVAILYVLVGVTAVPAVLVAVGDVCGRRVARTVAPFLVLVPGAIWIGTSGDAFFTGVGAWAVALVVLATGRRDRRGDVLALAGGLLFGALAFLSYGLVLLAAVPIGVASVRRRVRPLVLAALGASPVFVAFAVAGFWWLDGWAATRHAYAAGVASRRPYGYFLLADLAAFALVVGPAVAVALAWLRDRRVAVLTGAAFVAVALADVSGMSKAEVERIWLPFAPWALVATATFATTRRPFSVRALLVLQVATAVAVQAVVRSPW